MRPALTMRVGARSIKPTARSGRTGCTHTRSLHVAGCQSQTRRIPPLLSSGETFCCPQAPDGSPTYRPRATGSCRWSRLSTALRHGRRADHPGPQRPFVHVPPRRVDLIYCEASACPLRPVLGWAAAQRVLPTIAASGIQNAQAGAPGPTAVKTPSRISSGRSQVPRGPRRLAREAQRDRR